MNSQYNHQFTTFT